MNKLFVSVIFLIGAVFLFSFVLAYSPYYTHPDLTEEIINLWNSKNDNPELDISQNEIEWMRQGAINEDTPARWINHFYDPVHNIGWSGKHFGYLSTEKGLYEGESMAPKPAVASIDWVTNQEYQSAYGRQHGNQTWQKALKTYVDGDRKAAFTALGHILHLIEDASVPDHTRNDTHADLYGDPGSPYEKYSKEYTNSNQNKLNIAENLKNDSLFDFSTIQDAFNHLANYSNNNFFSEDTISNDEFKLPDMIRLGSKMENIDNEKVLFLYDHQKQVYLAVLQDGKKYSIDDKVFILPSYFSHLSSQAVLTGASVLDLFFREAEKYKQSPELLPPILEDSKEAVLSYLNKSPRLAAVNISNVVDKSTTDMQIYYAKAIDLLSNTFQNTTSFISNAISQTGSSIRLFASDTTSLVISPFIRQPMNTRMSSVQLVSQEDSYILSESVASTTEQQVTQQLDQPADPLLITSQTTPIQEPDFTPQFAKDAEAQISTTTLAIIDVMDANTDVLATTTTTTMANVAIIPPQGGGWASASMDSTKAESPQINTDANLTPIDAEQTQNSATSTLEELIKPEKPVITTNNGQDLTIQKFASQYPERKIAFILEGAKAQNAGEIFINNSSENINYPTATSWEKDFVLQEGENAFEAYAKDSLGGISDISTININLQFDNSTFYLTDYDVRKMNFTLNWSDINGVVKDWELEYKLAPNFNWEILCGTDAGQCKTDAEDQSLNSHDFTAEYDDLTYYFRLRGQDANGNFSDYQYLDAEISTKPVVINEIAWMGTGASASDEWIELINKTNQEIDMNGWILKTTDGIIDIKLEGKISANGFYLLERTNDDPVLNITADQVYTGVLKNRQNQDDPGQELKLFDKDNIEIDSVRTLYSGDNDTNRTSERVSAWSSSLFKNNWQNYKGEGGEAIDTKDNKIYGTPKMANSVVGVYPLNNSAFGWIPLISTNAVFLKNRGLYIADGPVDVAGVKILIEPGVSFEFSSFGMLRINDSGELIAKGMKDEKIIIKSSNSNGTALYFVGAKGEFENMEISGGKIAISNSIIKISDSVIKDGINGLLVLQDNSEFYISDNEFSGNAMRASDYGGEAILVKQSKGNIKNNVIKNNRNHGIYIDSLSGALDISGNDFSGSATPVATNGFINFGPNSLNIEDNTFNGSVTELLVYNPFINDGQTAIISDKVSYVLYDRAKGSDWYKVGDPEIKLGGTLKIDPGAVIKFNNNSLLKVFGRLEAVSVLERPIVFKWQWDYASYDDVISNIEGTLMLSELNESDYIQLYDGSEAVIENVIIRRKVIDAYNNTSYRSYWLTRSSEF